MLYTYTWLIFYGNCIGKYCTEYTINGWYGPLDTLPETSTSHLTMDGWKMNFLLG